MNDNMTLADHAEAWAHEQGRHVPKRNTKAWKQLYADWIVYAFRDGWR